MTDRNAYISGLRKLADALETHPEVPLPYEGETTELTLFFFAGDDPKAEMAAAARALPTSFRKEADGKYFDLKGHLDGVQIRLCAMREQVCERVVTGTREEVVEEPDPDALAEALAAVPTVTKTVTVEDVEWRCSPVLAPAGDKAVVR
jgi:hypothetical protein